MNIDKKLQKVIEANGFGPLVESRRLRPALVTTARGVTIDADHARIVRHPSTGTRILVMGIIDGRRNVAEYVAYNNGDRKYSLTRVLPDFTAPGEWVPGGNCDETGWCEPDESGHYDAHRDYYAERKFRTILTAFMDNIRDIEWV
jgi:hypothetical protein